MISLRQAFGNALLTLAKTRDDFVVLDADVAGGTFTHIFRQEFPDRFIQCGIAEQNMMSMAAGLSTTGIIPIVTTYGIFASMRALDQARNSIAYPRFNVKIAASHVGIDVGPDGPSHQIVEDLAIWRSIPKMVVLSPADSVEMLSALSAILDYDGPVYMRTGRSPVPDIHNSGCNFSIGKGEILRKGKDVTIIGAGIMVHRCLEAAELLSSQNILAEVINLSSLKPIDSDLILQSAKKTKAVVTAEDHNIIGGLGGSVSELLCENLPTPLIRVGIRDSFGESGDPKHLAEKFHIDTPSIIEAVKKVLSKK